MGHIGDRLLLQREQEQSVESWVGVQFCVHRVTSIRQRLDGRCLTIVESEVNRSGRRCFRNQLFLDGVVVVLEDLDADLEFV